MGDQDRFPEVCGWFGVRKVVMGRTMDKIKSLEAEGKPVTNEKFAEIIKGEWDKAKKEQKTVCKGL